MAAARARRPPRPGLTIGGIVVLAVLSTTVAPVPAVWAEEAGAPAVDAPVVGGFGVGDGIEAMLDERVGALRFTLPVGGLDLTWDSRAVPGGDRFGLGAAWGLGIGVVETSGGVRFAPASGGRYEVDASHPSGLHGYGAQDIAFRTVDDGVLPARAEAGIAARSYRYRLHEPGGIVTSFDDLGNPIERTSATGRRTTWEWSGEGAPRLERVVDPDGVVTELDWSPHELLIRPAANLPGPQESGASPEWRLELGADGVRAIVDPTGGRVDLTYESGFVSSIDGVDGVRTAVDWRPADDGSSRVSRLVATEDGVEVSRREWSPIGSGLPSGWPEHQGGAGGGVGFLPSGREYSTELSDGSTAVRSTYSATHLLRSRTTAVATATGERVLQEQALRYPLDDATGGQPDPGSLPGDWNRPISTSVRFVADDGAARTTTSTSQYDDLGRPTRVTGPDGLMTETVYDDVVPPGALVPIGLAQSVTTTAADGQVAQTVHTLNAERTAVIATDTLAGRTGAPLVVTGGVDATVEPDGLVSEERRYPAGDRGQAPVTTRRTAAVDLVRGTRTVTEITAVGTSAEASASVTSSLRHGRPLEQTDALGNRITTDYDELGRPVRSTDAAGRSTTTSYETAQQHGRNAVTVTGPDGVARTEVRDGVGRLQLVTDNLEHGVATPGHVRVAESREYEGAGTVVVTDAWGGKTIGRQDVFGRPVATESPGGVTQLTRYDEVGNTVTRAITPTGELADAELVSVDTLDAAGRAVATTGSRDDAVDVPRASTAFDGFGRVVSSDDGTVRSETAHDPLGNPVTTTVTPVSAAPDGRVLTERRFDAFGASLGKTVTDATGAATGGARAFDAAGRVRSMTDQLGRETTTEYTPDGLVARVVDGNGQRSSYFYDDRTRQLVRVVVQAPGKPTVETVADYDDRTGRLASIAESNDPAGTEVRYTYDDFGNVRSVSYPGGREISHRYDEHGRRVATTDATGATTTFGYRADGLMTSVVQRESADESSAVLARVDYRYDELGRVAAIERGNGVVTAYTFTSASEIATESTTRDGVELSDRTYEYAPSGMLVARVDRECDEQTGRTEVETTAYRYDALDRLVESAVHDGASAEAPVLRRTSYTTTVSGDVATEITTSNPGTSDERTTRREFTYSALGELTAITTDGVRVEQAYDAAGNLVRGADGTTYAYDAANRPIGRTHDGRTVQTSYWGDGARRSQTRVDDRGADPVETTYYWDGGTLVNDVHGGARDAGTASYLLGASRHARTTTDDEGVRTAAYYGTDRHGNVTDLTDDDGVVQARYAYSDYGVQTSESVAADAGLARNPFGYAGEQVDDDGSLYLRTRVYQPAAMRFTSEDPAERFDRYNYADLNPIMMVDPTGRTPQWDEIVDLVTGGLALASFASSVIMAGFTGGLSLTGLGIMALASDVVTVLAVTARSVDREMPDLGILDEGAQKMLLGVELAFGAFGMVGVGTDVSQLRTAERLHAAERDADRLLGATWDVTAILKKRAKLIASEHYGAPTRPHKGNIVIDVELAGGDAIIALARTRAGERADIVDRLSAFSKASKALLDSRHPWLKHLGTYRVWDKVADLVRTADGDQEAIAALIGDAEKYWADIKAKVSHARTADPDTLVNGLPSKPQSGTKQDWEPDSLLIPGSAFE